MTTGRIIAKTVSGEIEGVFEQNQCIFKGIPYAAPPVGDLRWLPPQPPAPWKGIRPRPD